MKEGYRNYFREFYCSQEDDETIEQRFEEDPEVQRLSQQILIAKIQMNEIVGSNIRHWLKLEEMLNERETILEEMYFNAGFEHGNRRGEAEALMMLAPSEANQYREGNGDTV